MFNNFGLSKTQAWVPMAVLLLCFSIRPYTSYPIAQDNEDPTDVDGGDAKDDDDNPQVAPNEGENPEGEYAAAVEEAGAEDVENTDDKGELIHLTIWMAYFSHIGH